MPDARIVFHLPKAHLSTYAQAAHLGLFRRVAEVFGARGAKIVVRDRRDGPFEGGPGAAAHYDDGDLHILDIGRVQGRGVLNAAVAYVQPYWHLDAAGVQAESSIGAMHYQQSKVGHDVAGPFFEDMRRNIVLQRRSRRDQMERVTEFAPGAIAVFLQGERPAQQGLAYCDALAMLRAAARGAGGRQVLVKPHPLALEEDAAVMDAALAEGLAITPTLANVHDILAACAVTVSFNSAVALEGFLHRKPAILFGPSDFHHFAETVRDPADFPLALHRA
ncbi:MAG: hypothetical protein ACRC6I_02755, partial [Paracoccaceae bacterium]